MQLDDLKIIICNPCKENAIKHVFKELPSNPLVTALLL
jgi:hypothetical protein